MRDVALNDGKIKAKKESLGWHNGKMNSYTFQNIHQNLANVHYDEQIESMYIK